MGGRPQGQAEKGHLARASRGFQLPVQQAELHPGGHLGPIWTLHLAPRPDPPGRSAQGQVITGDCTHPGAAGPTETRATHRRGNVCTPRARGLGWGEAGSQSPRQKHLQRQAWSGKQGTWRQGRRP